MRREGKLLQMIIHPNIVQLFELMETENRFNLINFINYFFAYHPNSDNPIPES